MPGFLREHSLPIVFSVLLHGLLAALLVYGALISVQHAPVSNQPLPIDAVVVDSQVLRAAQRAVADQDAARAKAAAEQQTAAAAAAQAETEAKQAEEATSAANEAARAATVKKAEAAERLASEEKAVAEERAAEDAHAAVVKRADDAKRAQEAKREADAKQAEDAKHAADQAKSEREAELRRQMAAEERANAVQSSPLRDQYVARLQGRIQNAWIRPPSARVGLDCLLEVTQSPGGEVLSARVTQCNGDAVTSDSIVNAAYRASPLPTPPDPALFARTFVFHFHPDQ